MKGGNVICKKTMSLQTLDENLITRGSIYYLFRQGGLALEGCLGSTFWKQNWKLRISNICNNDKIML